MAEALKVVTVEENRQKFTSDHIDYVFVHTKVNYIGFREI
jgi:hypothetical protein